MINKIFNFKYQYIQEILFLMGSSRSKIPFLVFLFLFSSILDIVGLGLIGPYVSYVFDPDIFFESSIGRFINSAIPSAKPQNFFYIVSIGLIIIILIKTISIITIQWLIMKFAANERVRLQTSLMSSYQRLPYIKYIEHNSAEYIQTIHDKANFFAQGVLISILNLISSGIVGLALFAFLAYTNIIVLLTLVIIVSLASITYDRTFYRRVKKYGELSTKGEEILIKGINEGIAGFKEIRILGKSEYFLNKVDIGAKQSAKNTIKANLINLIPPSSLEFILFAFVIAAVMYTNYLGFNSKDIIPLITIFGLGTLRLRPVVSTFLNSINQIRFCRYATSIVYRDMKRSSNYRLNESSLQFKKNNFGKEFENLEINNISFKYPNTNNWAIEEISLSINKGDSIGVIGPSGAGKTTLIDLLLGLIDPQSGKIQYNGNFLEDNLSNWQSNVAYLPQEIFLTDDTLSANIALGIDEEHIDYKKISGILEKVKLATLVDSLPKGLKTIIGERGAKLSGGQRQRIALARAFYHDRDVLIMDEATSALDNETENEIVNEIKGLKGKKTLIVIAHRFSTIKHCDKIYKLEFGRIVDQGSYTNVIRN